MIGQKFSHYTILKKLGEARSLNLGGYGVPTTLQQTGLRRSGPVPACATAPAGKLRSLILKSELNT